MVTRALLFVSALLVTFLVACQGGDGKPSTGAGSGSGTGAGTGAEPGSEAGFGTPDEIPDDALGDVEDAGPKVEEPDPPDPGKLIAELGAIPAWQAVVDRARLLGRRGQHGIAFGTIGPPILVAGPPAPPSDAGPPVDAGLVPSPYVWLVDDTEGHGTLGIRVALGGAWQLDDDRRWYWRVDAVTPLPAGPASNLTEPPAPVPTHDIATGPLPPGARPITLAKDHDAVYFQIVGPPPARDGDGWLVANELGDKPFARLALPGERASYGGQDMRADDERWQLRRGQTYWVRIGRIRKHAKPDEPVSITARTAPVRVN